MMIAVPTVTPPESHQGKRLVQEQVPDQSLQSLTQLNVQWLLVALQNHQMQAGIRQDYQLNH